MEGGAAAGALRKRSFRLGVHRLRRRFGLKPAIPALHRGVPGPRTHPKRRRRFALPPHSTGVSGEMPLPAGGPWECATGILAGARGKLPDR
jgi:hypothetical protein